MERWYSAKHSNTGREVIAVFIAVFNVGHCHIAGERQEEEGAGMSVCGPMRRDRATEGEGSLRAGRGKDVRRFTAGVADGFL
jgi:hypothetical protein